MVYSTENETTASLDDQQIPSRINLFCGLVTFF
jgi:hypothetical protein